MPNITTNHAITYTNMMFCAVGSSWFHHLSGHILQVSTVTPVQQIFLGPLFGGADIIREFLWQSPNMHMTILDSTTDVRYYQNTLASVSYQGTSCLTKYNMEEE